MWGELPLLLSAGNQQPNDCNVIRVRKYLWAFIRISYMYANPKQWQATRQPDGCWWRVHRQQERRLTGSGASIYLLSHPPHTLLRLLKWPPAASKMPPAASPPRLRRRAWSGCPTTCWSAYWAL